MYYTNKSSFFCLRRMRRSYHFCHSNNYYSHQVLESDLHLLLKYYISVVPRAEQVVVMIFWCYCCYWWYCFCCCYWWYCYCCCNWQFCYYYCCCRCFCCWCCSSTTSRLCPELSRLLSWYFGVVVVIGDIVIIVVIGDIVVIIVVVGVFVVDVAQVLYLGCAQSWAGCFHGI